MYKSIIDVISDELRLEKEYINEIVYSADKKYRCFKIEKKNKKKRTIYKAFIELETLQYWVSRRLLSLLPISNSAYAYVKGKSIKGNAEKHINSKHVFHTDINDFFPSVSSDKLCNVINRHKNILNDNGLWYNDTLDVISKICFRYNKLCIGAVSSPLISNIVMYDFDNDMEKYCLNNELIYSRYADDIYVSSEKYIPKNIIIYVNDLFNGYGYKMNYDKTSFYSSKGRIRITGLNIVNNERLSIGTKTKEKVKTMIYKYIKYNDGNPDEILGYLSYLKDVEPKYYTNLILKYSKLTYKDLYTFILTKM